MVDAHHRADDVAGEFVLDDEAGHSTAVALRPEEVGPHGHHAARRVNAVDRIGIAGRGEAPDEEAGRAPAGRLVGREVEPVGVRGIEEHLLRRERQHHVRVAHVDGDVAPLRRLGAHRLDERLGALEGLAEEEAPPAAVDRRTCLRLLRIALPPLAEGRHHGLVAHALEAVGIGAAPAPRCRTRHACLPGQSPCVCSHISSRATCHSSEPRRGVMALLGSANSRSR